MKKRFLLLLLSGLLFVFAACSSIHIEHGTKEPPQSEDKNRVQDEQSGRMSQAIQDQPQGQDRLAGKNGHTGHAGRARHAGQAQQAQQAEKEQQLEGEIKGIYVTAQNIVDKQRFSELMQLLEETELNAVVIDIKDDQGHLTYQSQLPIVQQIDSHANSPIHNLKGLLEDLKKRNVYTIARIVAFKDPHLAEQKKEWAIQHRNGGLWRDRNGLHWVDPYNPKVWEYITSISQEVARLGFDEIQFDYIRFPDSPKKLAREAIFTLAKGRSKAEVISEFLAYARKQLKGEEVYLSADVFGLTTTARDDMGIGQQWELITQQVDAISPMMYPSHYADGSYGLPDPEAAPHQTIEEGLKDAIAKNNKLKAQGKKVAKIRPWYQDFDYHEQYDIQEVKAQIKAGKELGVEGYLLWNQANRYSK